LSLQKCRFGIKFKKAHGEDSADAVSDEKWKSTKLPNLLQKCCVDDIYNADETGLFYPVMPDRFLSYKHTTLSGSKKAMDCVTVLCCSSMTGTDKWKTLVIGKRAKHWCFREIVSTKTIQNCLLPVVLNTDLEMPNKTDSENDVILEMHHGNYERIFIHRQQSSML
jgi:hypothetical protein